VPATAPRKLEVREETAMMQRLRNAWHNIVIHPLAGACWLFGLEALGDWIHGDYEPVELVGGPPEGR